MNTKTLASFLLIAGCAVAVVGSDLPREREATPAVVNPVARSVWRTTLSLDGAWEFAVDPQRTGEAEAWFKPGTKWPAQSLIQVPGCWEAQGIGGPGLSRTVTPEQSIRAIGGSYKGAAWYRKKVEIPASWAGRRLWLKIGGVNSQGWFWVNGTYLGRNAAYCGTYKYDITDLAQAGQEAVIAARVRNDVPSAKGLHNWVQRFGGLCRSAELEATPDLLIDEACVVGDLDRQSATVQVQLRQAGAVGAVAEKARLSVRILTLPEKTPAGEATAVVSVPAGRPVCQVSLITSLSPFRAWSPDDPRLYLAEIELRRDGQPVDGWVERFGVKKWEVRGGQFFLNNQPHFVRGFGDDSVYPLTLISPASREEHLRHLQVAKQYGFTYVRHHTHCEWPEFFEAADEAGIMVQPELPYYGNAPSARDPAFFRPAEDLKELFQHYRRYVSLSTYCTGNEGHLGSPLDREIYQLAKRMDPSRLVLHQDGGVNTPENSDSRNGPVVPWRPGSQDGARPFIAHEYLNLATDEDPRLEGRYKGAIRPPITAPAFRQQLERSGLSWDWGTACLDAGDELKRFYQKRGLEQARLDPVCDGYIYWAIVDVGNPAAQGLLNQFWEPKKTMPADFEPFNGPTALLARFGPDDTPVLAAREKRSVEWWISHFGTQPLTGKTLRWQLLANDTAVAEGVLDDIHAGCGEVRKVGEVLLSAPALETAVRAKLLVGLEGTAISNSWDWWIFPKREPLPGAGKNLAFAKTIFDLLSVRYPGAALAGSPEGLARPLLVTDRLNPDTLQALDQGKSVLLLGLDGPKPGVGLGWWALGNQRGTAIARHPAFGSFPHDGYLGPALFRLVNSTALLSREAYRNVEPLMVGRGSDGYLAYVFQAKAGRGRVLATGLNLLTAQPEARYLLDEFIRHLGSDQFQPQASWDLAAARRQQEQLVEMRGKLNGWARTLTAPPAWRYDSFLGELALRCIHDTDRENELAWQTQPVPQDRDENKPFTFRWVGASGYISQPLTRFAFYCGDRELFDVDVVRRDTTWKSADGAAVLQYNVKSSTSEDSSGLMSLTVPGAWLKPGEPVKLRLTSPQAGGRRWVGIYEYP
jgi:beta-galactosidase